MKIVPDAHKEQIYTWCFEGLSGHRKEKREEPGVNGILESIMKQQRAEYAFCITTAANLLALGNAMGPEHAEVTKVLPRCRDRHMALYVTFPSAV
eukprot:1150131-Pelagomonas_calceolata.AAC.5